MHNESAFLSPFERGTAILVLSIIVYIVYAPGYIIVYIHYYLLLDNLLLLSLALRWLLWVYSYYCLMLPYCWKSTFVIWFSLVYQILLVHIHCSLLLGLHNLVLAGSLVCLSGTLLLFYFIFLWTARSYWAIRLKLIQVKLLCLLLSHVRLLNCKILICKLLQLNLRLALMRSTDWPCNFSRLRYNLLSFTYFHLI